MKFYNICQDCKQRYPGCHGKCEAYLENKAKWEAEKEKIREQKLKERDIDNYHTAAVRRSIKRREGL